MPGEGPLPACPKGRSKARCVPFRNAAGGTSPGPRGPGPQSPAGCRGPAPRGVHRRGRTARDPEPPGLREPAAAGARCSSSPRASRGFGDSGGQGRATTRSRREGPSPGWLPLRGQPGRLRFAPGDAAAHRPAGRGARRGPPGRCSVPPAPSRGQTERRARRRSPVLADREWGPPGPSRPSRVGKESVDEEGYDRPTCGAGTLHRLPWGTSPSTRREETHGVSVTDSTLFQGSPGALGLGGSQCRRRGT